MAGLAYASPPPRSWDGDSGSTRTAFTPHAAREGACVGGSWDGGGRDDGGYDGGCWDADAIRLVEQLGGTVEMVTTPGLVAEAFITLPRGGAGHH